MRKPKLENKAAAPADAEVPQEATLAADATADGAMPSLTADGAMPSAEPDPAPDAAPRGGFGFIAPPPALAPPRPDMICP